MKSKIIPLFLFFLMFSLSTKVQAISFIEEYSYNASDSDSKLTCRAISLLQVKKLLLEKMGTYLQTNTELMNFQLSKDEITSLSAGIVKTEILEEHWDGKTYKMKAEIEVDPSSLAKEIDLVRKSGKRIEEVEEVNDKYLNKIEELKQELNKIQNDFIQVTHDYDNSSKLIAAWDSFETGMQLIREGKFEKAISALNLAIESTPKYIYFYHRGRAHMKSKQFEKALEDFTTVIDMNPSVSDAYFNRGRLYRKLGKKRKGLADIRKSAKLGNGNAKRWLKLRKK